jgi:hypothetical protein
MTIIQKMMMGSLPLIIFDKKMISRLFFAAHFTYGVSFGARTRARSRPGYNSSGLGRGQQIFVRRVHAGESIIRKPIAVMRTSSSKRRGKRDQRPQNPKCQNPKF